ncbi:MAG: pyridoxal phosphate-dependent aminotransferase [Bacteroidales bacterium]|nr:pyridoxal phosphate-dependent aminotransferase [Bacteroidales bacterium]MBQ5979433.1 pyridoxal phosphate-dependent aminotransferase [Bacteroidales bacterium]
MPGISERGNKIPASPIRKLTPFADATKSRGTKVYHLNIGQPDLPTPKKALDALKAIDRTTLEYSPSNGYKPLRDKLVRYYDKFGVKVSESEIIVTAGGSEALLLTFMTCLNPGDEIIMTEPGYANYISFAVTAGVTIKTVTSRIEDGFALPSVEDFEKAITPRTKAILICNPNNPTGYLYSEEELYRLRDIVRDHDLYLISDEVYREFRYTDEPYLSALCLEGIEENVIVVDSVSKRYSECGIRIGMIVSHNADVMKTVMKFCQARLSPPLLGQIVAEASIEGTEEYSKACFEEYLSRRDFFIEGLNKIPGVYSPMPRGAFYTVASLPVDDAEDFCKWCLSEFSYKDAKTPEGFTGETVMMAPAAGFYSTPGLGRNQVRMAYVLKKEDLSRALTVLEKALEAYKARG